MQSPPGPPRRRPTLAAVCAEAQPRWLPALLHTPALPPLASPVPSFTCQRDLDPEPASACPSRGPPPTRPRGSGGPSEGRSVPRVRVPEAHRPPALWSVLSAVRLAASCPAALGPLSPPCTGQTLCLHAELGSSPAPWLSCRGCRCLLWSVGCPLPSPGALAAFCLLLGGTSVPAAPGKRPAVGPSPHGPGWLLWRPCRLQARLPWAPERQGHTLWTRV